MEYLNWTLENLEGIWTILASIVTVASLVAALTPSTKDDVAVGSASSWLTKIKTIVNLLAINVKNAKPKQ